MNKNFKYILQPYTGIKSRTTCPSCNKRYQFTPYINVETQEMLSAKVGRCNREIKCGYHYRPKQYFDDNENLKTVLTFKSPEKFEQNYEVQAKNQSFISFQILKKSQIAYHLNYFARFLIATVGEEIALEVLDLYHVGTSKHWTGATIFWQIDLKDNVRAGKIMLYDKESGHRVKKPYPHITWVHKVTDLENYSLSQCLFGEHLIKLHPEKPIAIVESEKTAILATAYQPDFNWLATGNINNLSRQRCLPLKSKTVLLFPDAGAFHVWKKKAEELKDMVLFIVSDLVEKNATPDQVKKGFDLGDYFKGQPDRKFTAAEEFEQNPNNKDSKDLNVPERISQLQKAFDTNIEYISDSEERQNTSISIKWPIKELEEFFSSIDIPDGPILISRYSKINDLKKFIKSHLEIIKTYNGDYRFESYFKRLICVKEILINHK